MSQVWHGIDWDEVDHRVTIYHDLHAFKKKISPEYRPEVIVARGEPVLLVTIPGPIQKGVTNIAAIPGAITSVRVRERGPLAELPAAMVDSFLSILFGAKGNGHADN